jgi:hypothetical protein
MLGATGAICGTRDFLAGLMDLLDGSLMLLGPTMDPRQVSESRCLTDEIAMVDPATRW